MQSIEEALRFYCDLLGFEVVMQADIPAGIGVMADVVLFDSMRAFDIRYE